MSLTCAIVRSMVISLCVMYWAKPDTGSDLSSYLNQVLDLITEHGGVVLQRGVTTATDNQPLEVHIMQFESEDMLDNFMGDERRVAFAPERERVIARMEIMRMTMQPLPVAAGR